MKILAVDVGTGTQDILLFDTRSAVENAVKLVMPSPTLLVGRRVREATRRRASILFEGPMMGGGPSAWALRDHAAAGLTVYATPDAALTLDDDLERVRALGITLVSEDESRALRVETRVQSGDLRLQAIHRALAAFDVPPRYDALAVAVFDHGNAPPGVSDRKFRFDYLRRTLQAGGWLTAFAHARQAIPKEMTRLASVERATPDDIPLLLMDTGPAAILGALEDRTLAPDGGRSLIVANVGNFHCLAFHLVDRAVAGLFEHHTGEVSRESMERMLVRLGEGTLTDEEVFGSMGHGALVLEPGAVPPSVLGVLGPQRNLLRGSRLNPRFAVPHGDQMLAGCYGLLRGAAARLPELADELSAALDSTDVRQPEW
ncbi:MAG: DUF1786 domain-containing protein [Chloroflexota bacterium]|nr:DUF1786 domain-containing protein [Chloroflexota bacterium]